MHTGMHRGAGTRLVDRHRMHRLRGLLPKLTWINMSLAGRCLIRFDVSSTPAALWRKLRVLGRIEPRSRRRQKRPTASSAKDIVAMKTHLIALFCSCCALAASPIPAIAETRAQQTKVAAPSPVREIPPPVDAVGLLPFGILRQDLFDRNNPRNLRSDWHSPPAQPGQ